MRGGLIACVLLAGGCSTDFKVPQDSRISCSDEGTCPGGFRCILERCVLEADFVASVDPPEIIAVTADSETQVTLAFSEELYAPLIPDTTLYTITNGLSVVSARLGDDSQSVLLQTSVQTSGDTYSISVQGVLDSFGYEMVPQTVNFVGFGVPPDATPPVSQGPDPTLRTPVGDVALLWTPRFKASSYTVEVATDANFMSPVTVPPLLVEIVPPAATPENTVTVNLPDPVTYYWRVRADTSSDWSPVSTIEAADAVLRVHCAAGDDCSSGVQAGNRTKPFKSVERALVAAGLEGAFDIRVAARGSSERYVEALSVPPGVSLRGGFASGDFETADPSANETIIHSGTPTTLSVVGATQDAPRTTLVEGLTIVGGTRTGGAIVAAGEALLVSGSDGNLVIRDCRILGGTVSAQGYGVFVRASGVNGAVFGVPRFEDNEIIGPDVGTDPGIAISAGLAFEGSALTLVDNVIQGGLNQGGRSVGVSGNLGFVTATGNTIGSADQPATGTDSIGVELEDMQGDFSGNTITAGSAANPFSGSRAFILENADDFVVAFNVIRSSSGIQSWGVTIVEGAGTLADNDIQSGAAGGPTANGAFSVGVIVNAGKDWTVERNTISTLGASGVGSSIPESEITTAGIGVGRGDEPEGCQLQIRNNTVTAGPIHVVTADQTTALSAAVFIDRAPCEIELFSNVLESGTVDSDGANTESIGLVVDSEEAPGALAHPHVAIINNTIVAGAIADQGEGQGVRLYNTIDFTNPSAALTNNLIINRGGGDCVGVFEDIRPFSCMGVCVETVSYPTEILNNVFLQESSCTAAVDYREFTADLSDDGNGDLDAELTGVTIGTVADNLTPDGASMVDTIAELLTDPDNTGTPMNPTDNYVPLAGTLPLDAGLNVFDATIGRNSDILGTTRPACPGAPPCSSPAWDVGAVEVP